MSLEPLRDEEGGTLTVDVAPSSARGARAGTGPDSRDENANGDLEQAVAFLYANAAGTLLTGLAVALVVVVTLRGHQPMRWLAVWLAAQALVTVLRLGLVRAYRRARPAGVEAARLWGRRYAVGAATTGLLWGGALFFLSPDGPPALVGLAYMVGAGLCLGAIPLNAALYPVYLAFLLPVLAAMAVWPFAVGAREFVPLGVLGALLAGVSMVLAGGYHNALHALLRQRSEYRARLRLLGERNEAQSAALRRLQQLQNERQRERRLYLDGPVVVFRCRAETDWPIELVSPNVSQFGLDYEALALESTPFLALLHPDDAERLREEAFSSGGHGLDLPRWEGDVRITAGDGGVRWVYCHLAPAYGVYGVEGGIEYLDGYLFDVTELREAKRRLQREMAKAQVALNSIGDAVITIDARGRIETMNPEAERLTGWSADSARGLELSSVYRVLDEKGDAPPAEHSGEDASDTRTVTLRREGGSTLPIQQTVKMLRGRDGRPVGATIVFRDLSHAVAMERQLAQRATHDPLTGLLDRWAFEGHLRQLIRDACERGGEHVLLFIDLDQFKVVNDSCGHAAGDELLRKTADMLRQHFPERTIGRLGSDEFGVLLERCSLREGAVAAERIRRALNAFRFAWRGKPFPVAASIGVEAVTARSGDVASVLCHADMACGAAKDQGRNRVQVYHESDQDLARRQGEMHCVSQITQALSEDRFVLYYQEIRPLDHAPDRHRHIEILVRMLDEQGDRIGPGSFLPAAERYNLVGEIDRWVLAQALEWYGRHVRGGEALRMSINLSGATVGDESFLRFAQEQMRRHRVPPQAICFEVTESAAVAHIDEAVRFMRTLRAQGCRFSLDDFGSGLSSFGYLKHLPVDYLKIDGQFVKGIVDDPVDSVMVSAINEVGQAMGLHTIAEYVENESILRELNRLAVDYAQGYGVAPPKPLRLFDF